MDDRSFRLTAASNTQYLAILSLHRKGYTFDERTHKRKVSALVLTPESHSVYAFKDERQFSAETWLELLALITLWEKRGDDWELRDDEPQPEDLLPSIKHKRYAIDGSLTSEENLNEFSI